MRIFQSVTAAVILTGTLSPSIVEASPAAMFETKANLSFNLVSAVSLQDGSNRLSDVKVYLSYYLSDDVYDLTRGVMGGAGGLTGHDTLVDNMEVKGAGGSDRMFLHAYRTECYTQSGYVTPASCEGDAVAMTFDYVFDVSAMAATPDAQAPHEASAWLRAFMRIGVSEWYINSLGSERFYLSGDANAAVRSSDTYSFERTRYEGQITLNVAAGESATTYTNLGHGGRAYLAAPPPSPVPLPASALLLGAALAGLAGLRRLRRET